MVQNNSYKAGLDIGSTTAKIVIPDCEGKLVFSAYQRHRARIGETVAVFFSQIMKEKGDILLDLRLTGSAALNLSQKLNIPFVQEVIAADATIGEYYPDVSCAMDIGGEDAKMIFFSPGRVPDIRMNGSCAGGTGSFIDHIASLMNISPYQLNELAARHKHIYPVASRCGVFAKTDVQNMLSRNIPQADIAGSIFHAVALQCINSLARGIPIKPKMLLCGGVFAFLPELVKAFCRILGFSSLEIIVPEHSELIPAMGAALFKKYKNTPIKLSHLILRVDEAFGETVELTDRLPALFESRFHFCEWEKISEPMCIPTCPVNDYKGQDVFLGIDSGSTTTKIVIIGTKKEILFSFYQNNKGNPIKTLIQGLKKFHKQMQELNPCLKIRGSAVTGYGEDLIRAAFNMDLGLVETMAHTLAARFIDPDVSFILDIGGQDMKAVFIDQGLINRIELNEACSSGCGSFLEALAGSLNLTAGEFAAIACQAQTPCDLGTRCTVFMNSKIKQSLRENASIADISAGLSYAVIKNCLFKVLKLQAFSDMGDHIVLQGGTFKNASVVRALEVMTGKKVRISNVPELMGAFGAALYAYEDMHSIKNPGFFSPDTVEKAEEYNICEINCKGCENTCRVLKFKFASGQEFFSGNKCEKYFSAKGEFKKPGFDFFAYKRELLFNRKPVFNERQGITLGIPRCLNMFENFVFWHTLLTGCGFNIVLSSPSTAKMGEKGMGTLMSDNICFPAKLVHSHIVELIEKGVDRIFYPIVIYEKNLFKYADNAYNCPIVAGYADVIESAVNPEQQFGIPLDRPIVNFNDLLLLKKKCHTYLKQFYISQKLIDTAFETALAENEAYRQNILNKSAQIIAKAAKEKSLLIVLAGRPYHADSLINHKIPEIICGLGADIISEDVVPVLEDSLKDVWVLTQWAYPNRIYNAAAWVARQPAHVQMVQLNSFGCGPDAIVVDEVREILKTGEKNHTVIKIDEIASPGSVRLRLRSMIESLNFSRTNTKPALSQRKTFAKFLPNDKRRTILAPFFSEDYSFYLSALFSNTGYNFNILPQPDRESVDLGLQYANNDICYPGTIVTGDIIKALKQERFNRKDIAIGITQTGGPCRASNYLSLIRKAMLNAGYDDVPVISITTASGVDHQPGFKINWLSNLRIFMTSALFADAIAKMYYAACIREKISGYSRKIRQIYMEKGSVAMRKNQPSTLFKILNNAVKDFNEIVVCKKDYPKMGIVGEIYAKYNYFANQNLAHFLISQGIEPVIPPLSDFFIQDFINIKEYIKNDISRTRSGNFLAVPIEWMWNFYYKSVNKLLSGFRYALPFDNIYNLAEKASNILNITHQFGEGWLIAGEVGNFAEYGINDIISVQPFGCIANHIISKGIAKKIQSLYPQMNLYFLDFDPGISEANVRNRLHFMTEHLSRR
jgi:predicted CoA-substrate-specific enzyme activase